MKYAIFSFDYPIFICPGDKFILTVSRDIRSRTFGGSYGSVPKGTETQHTYEFTDNRRITKYARVELGPVSMGYIIGDDNLEAELQALGGTPLEA